MRVAQTVADLTPFDTVCLDAAIAAAEKTLARGNYPVGAALALDGTLLGVASNTAFVTGRHTDHAETRLLRGKIRLLIENGAPRGTATLYSTLEPCLMCLGAAVASKVSRIVYIEIDPHAGASGLDRMSLGPKYHAAWPTITRATDYSTKPRQFITDYINRQAQQGRTFAWHETYLKQVGK